MIKKFTIKISVTFILLLIFTSSVFAIGFNAENEYKSVVVIYSDDVLGSGFAIGNNCIITNAHVIKNQNNVKVSVYKDKIYSAKVLKINAAIDIAVIQIDNKTLPFLKIGDYNNVAIGADVYAIGAPKDMQYTITKGVLSAKDRKVGSYLYLQTDASINAGNSGGPLLSDSGEVIGVNTMKLIDSEGIGLSIPMTIVAKYLNDNNIQINEQGDIIANMVKNDINTKANQFTSNVQINKHNTNSNDLKTENLYLKIGVAFLVLSNTITVLLILLTRKRKLVKSNESENDFDIDIEIQE